MKTLELANQYKDYSVFSCPSMLCIALQDLGDFYYQRVWGGLNQNKIDDPFNAAYLTFGRLYALGGNDQYVKEFIDYIEKLQKANA